MSSSDDEGDMVPKTVSDYEFISGDDEPISFAKLPVEWNKGETHETKKEQIFLSGKTDNGLRKIYKQVIAWKFDLSLDKPVISVLLQEGNWIRLLKPRKPYEDIIRTILTTLHFLHFAKRNPLRPKEALWDRLNRSFSTFERRPSEDDLADHLPLINKAVKKDETLANSKLLITFLAEPVKRKTLNEVVKLPFIVDDENDNHQDGGLDETDENGDANSDEDECFDFVCAFCDNGGDLTMCDGICMRAFHATVEDGEDSQCESLGFTDEDLEAIKDISFICKNCQYKQHQCFACGELGSSDESSGPEVFCCANGACGFFYHPPCVAKLLHPGDNKAAEEHQQKIAAGEQFACPIHRCHACKELEVRSIKELQFAFRFLDLFDREIASEEDSDPEHGIVQRAWEDLLPKRVLIYCLDHEIDREIFTPARDHIKFPGPQREKKNNVESSKKNKVPLLGKTITISAKLPKGVKVSSSSKRGGLPSRVEELRAVRSSTMQRVTNKNYLGKLKEPTTDERETSLGNKLYSTFYAMDSGPVKSSEGGNVHCEHEKTQKVKPTERRINNSFTLDADTKKRILKLINDASSSLTLNQDKERHKAPSTNTQHAKFWDSITLGKVEGSVQSLRAALNKLEGGGSIQDAKMVCGNDLLVQMLRWKDKMRVYLAPFLHGSRYTSFGRHFTKMDKLKEIVDMLHWYVQDDDMNDFNFELRNWYDVRPDELPDGSQLIMGLNPPFGVNAALANKFINKALEFKPKLLILIVPRETERLDKKACQYDLIWEDDQMFAGKSFYLPGSVDVNDNQIEDWNVNAPVLYLWSHPSCTSKHRAIAEQHGHLPGGQKNSKLEENHNNTHVPSSVQETRDLDKPLAIKSADPLKPERLEQEERVTANNHGRAKNNNASAQKNHSKENPNKFSGKRKGKKRSNSSMSLEDEPASKRAMPRQLSPNMADRKSPKITHSRSMSLEDKPASKHAMPRQLLPNVADRKSLEITHSPKRLENQLQVHSGFDQMSYSSYQPTYASAAGYNGNETVDDVVRRYNLSGEPGMTSQPAYPRSPTPDYGFDRLMAGVANNYNNNSYAYDNRSSYMGEMNEEFNSWNQRSVYPLPPPPPPAYPGSGFPGGANPRYGEMNNTSVMQRYAPRLDDSNHGPLPPPPPLHDAATGIYHHRDARPAASSSLGFAPGPYRPYSQHNSSGWLNE
ncbi:phd finger-containing protein ddb_g0268158 [Phtheirospermum japonicum]|uniref:Phd finger-containing protein ddb_g0268158 n=1 Tax=Phtheirospermum japonicum TaxID=374723 RepID=A0A830BL17_9LAMI|nr:phd finger-containing protein ddb_g0268158 [Phtheirospermum japonicum]